MSSVPVRFSVLSLRRRPLAKALANGLLLTTVATAGAASAQSAQAEEEGRTPSQTLQTVQVTANQLGTITEGSGAYTPGTIATATRLVLTPRQTPQTISVITRAQMDDFGLDGIDDVMRVTPGISIVTYDSERTEYYARGFAVQNFQYDGIPMSRDSAYSAGNTLSDTAIYDRIEVLKGATGLLTGMGDPGATINLVRKKPGKEFAGSATLGVGRWDDYRAEVDVGGPLTADGRVRGRAVGAWQDKHSNLDFYQRTSKVGYAVLEADLGERTLLTVGGDVLESDPKGSTWGGIPLLDSQGNFNDMPRSFNNGTHWSGWRQYVRTGFATLEHTFDNDWVAKLQLNHQVNGYDAALAGAAGGNPDPVTGEGVSLWLGKYVGKTVSNAADFYLSGNFGLFGRQHELVVGGSASRKRWTNTGYSPQPGYPTAVADYNSWKGDIPEPEWQRGYGNNEVTRENGLYVVGRFDVADPLKVIVGSRLASYRSPQTRETGVFVPYAGVVYDLGQHYSVYASYSTIFKPHSERDEQGKALDPLEGRSYEMGLKAEFLDGRFNASAALFQLDQDNFAQPTGGKTPNGEDAYRALMGVRTKGYELEMSGQLAEGWQVQGGFAHKIARQAGSKVTTLEPENQFSLHTSYRLRGDWQGLTVGGGARWQDSTFGDITNPASGTSVVHRTQPYWLLDAMARYQFNDRLSATVNVNNLLDKRYYTIFSWYSTYTWGEPRNVRLAVTYKF
ncbi:MAG: TonB-dependent siderophore receptor [Stenotrophomonas indicatrix]|uniref:TonB-dependent siderophore receptor n=1 Tax=Stenotrophomonas indicatrix TaxID=2045451 RepID=UPI00242C877F|nr:TonB-dependent siderophore receptor [Stenotrophomonas indicatrix]MDF2481943.1 TonB-dependent siderophore receptor [Stenotrophomonas indicatrix]